MIIKVIQCTLLSTCVLVSMLQVLRDFKHFNNCDELLGKVKIDHYVCKIGFSKDKKISEKT